MLSMDWVLVAKWIQQQVPTQIPLCTQHLQLEPFSPGRLFHYPPQNKTDIYGCRNSSVTNKIGAKPTLLLGSVGYALYIGSFLYARLTP